MAALESMVFVHPALRSVINKLIFLLSYPVVAKLPIILSLSLRALAVIRHNCHVVLPPAFLHCRL